MINGQDLALVEGMIDSRKKLKVNLRDIFGAFGSIILLFDMPSPCPILWPKPAAGFTYRVLDARLLPIDYLIDNGLLVLVRCAQPSSR